MAWKGAVVQAAATVLLATALSAAAQEIGFLAIAEGKVALVRGTTEYTALPGIRIYESDILATDVKSQAHIQLKAGTLANLGPETRVLLAPAEMAMLSGWMKLALRKSTPPNPYRLATPFAQFLADDAVVVIHADAGLAEAFVESGSIKFAEVRDRTVASPRTVRGGEFVSYRSGQAPALAPRPPLNFIKAMPRQFQDPLPTLADRLKERKVEPRREHDVRYEEVQDWLKANVPVRKGFVKRFQARLRDREFRSAMVKNAREHPDWDRLLFPEKYEAQEKR